jgi:hypothetical protein
MPLCLRGGAKTSGPYGTLGHVTTAIFALLGVVIGGLLNAVVTAALDAVREGRRAMVAARLVADDLTYIRAAVQAELEDGTYRRLTGEEPPLTFSWDELRDVLASHLTFAEWAAVSVAARVALRIVSMAPMNPKPGEPISASERARLEAVLPRISDGITVLQPLVHGTRAPTLWRALRGMLPSRRALEPAE